MSEEIKTDMSALPARIDVEPPKPVRPQYSGYLNHGAQAQRKGH